MKRRQFITLVGGAAVAPSILWPLASRAQQPGQMKRVGYVQGIADDAEGRARFTAFRQALATLGWIEGRNIELVYRSDVVDPDRIRTTVAELLRLKPDVVVAGSPTVIAALRKETRTIPIVIANMNDPVARGFAESLARPGGNVTGFASGEQVMATKWLELLGDVAPGLTRLAVFTDPQNTGEDLFFGAIEAAASSRGIRLTAVRLQDDAEIEQAIDAFAREPNGGLIVPPGGGALGTKGSLIVGLAARHKLPAVYTLRFFVVDGGLMSYGPDVLDLYRRSASYVDRILKGAKPADLPIQQPTKYELIVNLKTAKALGLAIAESFLLRADEVIE
jgi:putative tryptophan/tyrosine transport system substrate-binding protein